VVCWGLIGELAGGGFTHRAPSPSCVVGIGRHVYAISVSFEGGPDGPMQGFVPLTGWVVSLWKGKVMLGLLWSVGELARKGGVLTSAAIPFPISLVFIGVSVLVIAIEGDVAVMPLPGVGC